MIHETHIYRVLKSSWGIWVSITATATPTDRGGGPGQPQSGVAFRGEAASLADAYREQLTLGWLRVLPAVRQATGDRQVELIVEQVDFVDTDFQLEGLAVAMCRWAEAAFNLSPTPVEVSFNREENRYVFEWADLPSA